MSKGFIGFVCFVAGAASGYFVAAKFLKDQYEQMVDEEVESIKKRFDKIEKEKESEEKRSYIPTETEKKEYVEKIKDLGYSENANSSDEYYPRVISPEEFGTVPGYEMVDLTYYADGTLTDDMNVPMDETEIKFAIGKESLTHFGEYEDDSVFVRNDKLKVDYEILLDQRNYVDTLKAVDVM